MKSCRETFSLFCAGTLDLCCFNTQCSTSGRELLPAPMLEELVSPSLVYKFARASRSVLCPFLWLRQGHSLPVHCVNIASFGLCCVKIKRNSEILKIYLKNPIFGNNADNCQDNACWMNILHLKYKVVQVSLFCECCRKGWMWGWQGDKIIKSENHRIAYVGKYFKTIKNNC